MRTPCGLEVLVVLAILLSCTAAASDDTVVEVSPKCAAAVLTSSGALGGAVAYMLTPAALCTAGFCSAGVTGGSFAAWWQSTLPLVVKGSLFSTLQAAAMGGSSGVSTIVTGGAIGGAIGMQYLTEFCGFVDATDPMSTMGGMFEKNLAAVRGVMEMKHDAQAACKANPTCNQATTAASAVGEQVATTASAVGASMWDMLSTAGSVVAESGRAFKRRVDIKMGLLAISDLKRELGPVVFGLISARKWSEIHSVFGAYKAKLVDLEKELLALGAPSKHDAARLRFCCYDLEPATVTSNGHNIPNLPSQLSSLQQEISKLKGDFGEVASGFWRATELQLLTNKQGKLYEIFVRYHSAVEELGRFLDKLRRQEQ